MPDPSKDAVPNTLQAEPAGCLSTIARVIWTMVGNFALLILMVLIVQKGTFSFIDIAFWTVVATVLFIRYADIKWLKGIDAHGGKEMAHGWLIVSDRLWGSRGRVGQRRFYAGPGAG